jgi:hypothetical protein
MILKSNESTTTSLTRRIRLAGNENHEKQQLLTGTSVAPENHDETRRNISVMFRRRSQKHQKGQSNENCTRRFFVATSRIQLDLCLA